jgi:hypothetical protein
MRNVTTAIAALVATTTCVTACSKTSRIDDVPAPQASSSLTPAATLDISGQLRLHGNDGFRVQNDGYAWCVGGGGFDDLHYGAQVTVTNARHEKVAIGELDEGELSPDKNQCWFDFTVPDVPDEPGVFTLQIAQRDGAQDFTVEKYRDQPGLFTLFLEAEDLPSTDDAWTIEDGVTQEEADCLNSRPDTWAAWEKCVKD